MRTQQERDAIELAVQTKVDKNLQKRIVNPFDEWYDVTLELSGEINFETVHQGTSHKEKVALLKQEGLRIARPVADYLATIYVTKYDLLYLSHALLVQLKAWQVRLMAAHPGVKFVRWDHEVDATAEERILDQLYLFSS